MSARSGMKHPRSGEKRKVTQASPDSPPTSKRKLDDDLDDEHYDKRGKKFDKIDWEARKEQCKSNDIETINTLVGLANKIIIDVMEETRGKHNLLGPTFICHASGSILKGIETTPWCYYEEAHSSGNPVEKPCCFIQKELYTTSNNYTEGQKGLKKAQLMKFKMAFQHVIYSKYGFHIDVMYANSLYNSE